jgi:adenylate cyclase
VAQPLERLAQEAAAIGNLRLEPEPIAHSLVLEVDRLALAMEEMKTGLRSFQKYVPADLVRALMESGEEARRGGERRTVTVYFGDIVNFTGIAEQLAPEVLVEQLSEYLNALSEGIRTCGGTVDKYIGDAIMAFWGAPARDPQHALGACTAAIRNQQQLAMLRREWQSKNKPPFATRIGLNTGDVVVGNIGSEARFNYTVIGDAVNLASRLEGLNKYYGTEILISESTYREAKSAVVARPIDYVSVKGKSAAVLVYELVGLKSEVSPADVELAELHGQALARYREQDWGRAIPLFEEVLRRRAGDAPAGLLLARCHSYRSTPPGPRWDGVHHMESK